MFLIEPRLRRGRDEELGTIRIGTSIGHARCVRPV
jgi:hypothetical protein